MLEFIPVYGPRGVPPGICCWHAKLLLEHQRRCVPARDGIRARGARVIE